MFLEHDDFKASRRSLLKWGALGTGLAATAAWSRTYDGAPYPPDVGSKFHADGRVHPFAGNTVICHLPQQGDNAACFNAMLDAYREAPAYRFMRKVALLPPSSYHMTVFGGANDRPRMTASWPADVPIDASLESCTRTLADRLQRFKFDGPLPIRMRIAPDQRLDDTRALTFKLLPADEAERIKLRKLRDDLADCLQIRSPGHDGYVFHLSFGYPIAWFDTAEKAEYGSAWRRWTDRIALASPEITLGPPEFCTFADMFAFHRLFFLQGSGSAASER